MAGVEQNRGNAAQVEQYLRHAERVSPMSRDVQLAWGRYSLWKSEVVPAATHFLPARELALKTIAPLLDIGELYLRMPGRASDFVQTLRIATQLDRTNRFA